MANIPNPTPGTVTQQGIPKVPATVPATGTPGLTYNQQFVAKGGALPSGASMNPEGGIVAKDASFAGPKDTVVRMADGSQTVLMANGLSVHVPAAQAAEAPSSGGGGGGGPPPSGIPPPATTNKPTKVAGPQTAKDLLPAFSPPALNQFPQFYDPGAYAPVAGSSNIPSGYSGPTVPDMGLQSSIAQILGVPWSASTLNLTPGQNGYGMPPVDMSKGGGLKSNYVDPRTYGYVSPTLNPAWFQSARSTAK